MARLERLGVKTHTIAIAAENALGCNCLIITCDCLTISADNKSASPEFWSSMGRGVRALTIGVSGGQVSGSAGQRVAGSAGSRSAGKPLSRLQFKTEPLRV